MQIRSIKLVNWKNFESATLAFAERLVQRLFYLPFSRETEHVFLKACPSKCKEMKNSLVWRVLMIAVLYLVIRLFVEYSQDGGFDRNFVVHQAFIGLAVGLALALFDRGMGNKK